MDVINAIILVTLARQRIFTHPKEILLVEEINKYFDLFESQFFLVARRITGSPYHLNAVLGLPRSRRYKKCGLITNCSL
jgi:hypothetical protein